MSKFMVYTVLLFSAGLVMMSMGVDMYLKGLVVILEWELIYISSVKVVYTILLDWMSLLFCGGVLFISSMVMYYSSSYMASDLSTYRFIVLVTLFVFSMLLMVISPNMISILLGWDGLGLVSYGLVVYYQNVKSANAGMITVLSNRLGDIAILVSIAWLLNYGSWDFFYLQYVLQGNNVELSVITALVVLAGMTKSAQVPFSAWLPAAMAAPTPISALVHSSTLVTAGVYLFIRFNELIGINLFLMYVSLVTLFMSGLGASLEYDFKKIIALSTLSQLGVMMFSLSIGLWEMAFFHLLSHAMFKSLLFLCAGAYIHAFTDSQDIRSIGGSLYLTPLVGIYFVGCTLSICGYPFLAGFYSKDLILEGAFYMILAWGVYIVLIMGVLFTVLYSARLIYYIYFKSTKTPVVLVAEYDYKMLTPMSLLFLVSVIVGSLFVWMFMPASLEVLGAYMKMLVLTVSVWTGLLTFYIMSLKFVYSSLSLYTVWNWYVGGMWFMPNLSVLNFVKSMVGGKSHYSIMDSGWLEQVGGLGMISLIGQLASVSDKWNIIYFKFCLFLSFMLVVVLIIL